jgi:NAD(P)-dependent dehydrogenase (short-subunit alcohol dehydrogenase family)
LDNRFRLYIKRKVSILPFSNKQNRLAFWIKKEEIINILNRKGRGMKKKEPNDLVMVLTGASSGIGMATVLKYAEEGGKIVLAARNKQALEEVAAECEKRGGQAHIVQTDVSKEDEVKHLAEEAVGRFGSIDVWVNNAAVIAFGGYEEIPPEDFRQVLEINLFGYTYGAREAIKQFRKQGRGTLINVSSVAGVVGQPFAVPYSVSKFGVRGLGMSLEQELKTEKDINICTIMPSTVDTPIYDTGANYTGRKVAPPVAVATANEVADAIIKLSKNPKKKVFVGNMTLPMRLGKFIFPNLFDRITYYMTVIKEFKEEGAPKSKGNLYEPNTDEAAISGGWMEKEERMKKTQKAAVGAGIILGLVLLLKRY